MPPEPTPKSRVKDEFQRNPISSFGVVVACVFSIASPIIIITQIDGRLTAVEKGNEEHHHDANEHMPLGEKIRVFVTRNEWSDWKHESDRQRAELRSTMIRVDNRVEKIYDLLNTRKQ